MEQQPDDLQAGFDADESTVETPPTSPEQQQVEPEQTPAEPEYVQLTKAELEELRQAALLAKRMPELEQNFGKRFDTAFGKIGGIERVIQEGKSGGALSDEDIAPFKDDLPELHAALSKLRAPANLDAAVEERLKPMAERFETVLSDLRATQVAFVSQVHPDWQEFTAKPEFDKWLETKDEAFRNRLRNTWEPAFIVQALNEAKKAAAPKDTSRNDVLEAAIQPRGTGSASTPSKSRLDAFMAGFNDE